jgi:hypothetical protein
MKHIKIFTASLGFALFYSHSSLLMAADSIPYQILDFAAENGLVLQQAAVAPVNKYPLDGKTINVNGKLSISGKATYQGHSFPFSAPGINAGTLQTTYIFGKKGANGAIPFTLKQKTGSFTGVMTPVKPDTYTLKMNNVHGSLLSGLVYAGQQSGGGVWKKTAYSYTAVVVKGVTTKTFEVKEQASFKINITTLPGATANYTYSYDWKVAIK